MNPRVSIIILNWNSWRDTVECLESVFQNYYLNYNVVVVDNHSNDESLERIREYCNGKIKFDSPFFKYNPNNKPIDFQETNKDIETGNDIKSSKKLILIKNDKNDGFAEGNNIGIRYVLDNLDSDYIMLLNNDTVVDKEFLVEMLKVFEKDNKIGIIGPKIYFYDDPNRIWFARGKISWKFCRGLNIGYNEVDTGQYNDIVEMEYASGCAFLIKKEVINKIGLIDKRFFLYFEEIDWTMRSHESGYRSLFVPNAHIWHKVSKTGGGLKGKIGLYYITRNRWLLMKKWANKTDFSFFVIYQAVGAFVIPLFLIIYYKKPELFLTYYRGLYSGISTMINDF